VLSPLYERYSSVRQEFVDRRLIKHATVKALVVARVRNNGIKLCQQL
jgi:hypothetical protein